MSCCSRRGSHQRRDAARGHPRAIGGDEFIVLCEDLHGPGEAAAIAARVRAVFTGHFLLSAGEASISASICVAVFAGGGTDPSSVIATADAAMYTSKQDGGDGFVVRRVGAGTL